MKLKGKVALVTGGGTGIGREISLTFAREGADVAVNYSRSEREATETSQEIQQLGRDAFPIKADVSQDTEVRAMVRTVVERLGRLDILVNNAGTTVFVPHDELENLSEEMWDRILAVNLKGVFFCCRAAAEVMKRQKSGAIISISSIAGFTGQGSSIPYCASKAGVINMTKSLARVLAPHVRVNAIAPGAVETRWTEGWDDFKEHARSRTPLQRIAQPVDVADAALFLAASSDFVTGQTITVDGGLML